MMIEPSDPKKKRHLQLAFAIAVLIGAIILLIATEVASVEESSDEGSAIPAESGPAP